MKRARGRGPAVTIEGVGTGELFADSLQVSWARIAVRPAQGAEEQPINGASGETGESGVGVASREADTGAFLWPAAAGGLVPTAASAFGGNRCAPRK